MSMTLKLQPTTALNLELQGSVGTFCISRTEAGDDRSIQVRYLETHIGFDASIASNESMLRHLEPVREIFDFQSLGFDEIMQRDIDDMRVSTELIPYVLDEGTRGRIKFFPPIVIVVLPIDQEIAKPGRYYPKVTKETVTNDPHRGTAEILRAGKVGQEVFQFEYPLVEGKPLYHDLARLKLNTNQTRLVILDGQHRAMALLAIYRNLRDEWTDARRIPFKNYYQEWTKKRIQSFDLKSLQLPVIVCTFPELDETYSGDFDIIRAARTTFLTLNKTARKVSASRNILLDDRDLISHFLREALGTIKQQDQHAPHSLRIWNVELDQYRDKVQIESPMACTGVTHVYYAIEHMLLDEGDVKGLSARSGKFHKRTYVEASLLRRLDGENLLGATVAGSLKRDDYSLDAAKKLSVSFMRRYGTYLIGTLGTFSPFEIHNRAAIDVETSLQGHVNPQIRTILFEGQNIGRTFDDYLGHMEGVADAAKKFHTPLAPEIQASLTQLRGTKKAVQETYEKFGVHRAELYISKMAEKAALKDATGNVAKNVRSIIDRLYSDRFSTVAFQAALVCGYFLVVEKAERRAAEQTRPIVSRDQSFDEYMEALNTFFVPATLARFKNLVRVFYFDIEGDKATVWKEVPSPNTFNDVVFRAEMKPDEWPKYRYLLLELWRSTDPTIDEVAREERDVCRQQAFSSLYDKKTKDYCLSHQKNESDLAKMEWESIFAATYDSFDTFLKNLGLTGTERMSKEAAKSAIIKGTQTSKDAEAQA